MKQTIIIGGGVGPMAGVALHRQIILNTVTEGTDQDHIDVIHLSYASRIADRTDYLLNPQDMINPGSAMAEVVEQAYRTVQALAKRAAVGIPCNTFHAQEIFAPFTQQLVRTCPELGILNMLEETGMFIAEAVPGIRRVGLLSTTGTRMSRVWHNLLEASGMQCIEVAEELQDRLHTNIYHPTWGIKALSKASERVRLDFDGFCQMLIEQGAEVIILGCTELPLIFPVNSYLGIPLIDPMTALARSLIRETSPSQLALLDRKLFTAM